MLLVSCHEEETVLDTRQAEEYISAQSGGVLVTSDSIKLTIPSGALSNSGTVFIGVTGYESTVLPNSGFEIIGTPVTIRLPAGPINQPVVLEVPILTLSLDTLKCFAVGYNGASYLPYSYTLDGGKVLVSIDVIDWESGLTKSKAAVSEVIIFLSFSKQYPPLKQMGLKKVTADSNGNLSFMTPTIKPASRVLLLIHGWTGDAERWNDFIPKIQDSDDLNYSEVWTFVYISAKAIRSNAEILKEALDIYAEEKQVDIVAHSMGGLVARSMIEQYDGAKYVNKLITLGTPHLGSPLAIFRMILGDLVSAEYSTGHPFSTYIYNYNTQGFNDLNVDSEFIQTLNQTGVPSVPYFTIASTNNPDDPSNSFRDRILSQQASAYLEGEDDGIVQVASALAMEEAISPDAPIMINTAWAHMAMTDDDQVFNQVLEYLIKTPPNSGSDIVFNPNVNYGSFKDPRDNNVYRTLQIGNQMWMAENMRYLSRVYPPSNSLGNWVYGYVGSDINEAKATDNYNTYGVLYNHTQATSACPTGWHLPSDDEWKELEDYLIANGYNFDGTLLEEKIGKSLASSYDWEYSAVEGSVGSTDYPDQRNITGFTGLPAGYRGKDGKFNGMGYTTAWWSSTFQISYIVNGERVTFYYYRTLRNDRIDLPGGGNSGWDSESGISVRCIKN